MSAANKVEEKSSRLAVIETGGKQYKVKEGQVFDIERLEGEGDVSFDKVLLISDDSGTKIGTPYIDNAIVSANILEQIKDEKKIIFKFKRKTGYKAKTGHRQKLTRVRVTKISA